MEEVKQYREQLQSRNVDYEKLQKTLGEQQRVLSEREKKILEVRSETVIVVGRG